jgi:phosphoribosyl 1,2-cyclic phosphodiesterase
MKIKFWGVRGSIPSPGPSTVKYGGNTTCVEVASEKRTIVFDAGSGIRPLGNELIKAGKLRLHLFLSHVHWDHIQGFPFFVPALRPGNDIHIYGSEKADASLGEILAGQMEGPHFPVSIGQMGSKIHFHDIKDGATIQIKNRQHVLATVQNVRLNHPNGVVGYRLTEKKTGNTVVFATDTEHYDSGIDTGLVKLARNADLFIYDGQYTPKEYIGGNGLPSHKSWGHSTWMEGIKIADQAGVKRIIITHHDPMHSDAFIDKIAVQAKEYLKNRKTGQKRLKIDWAYEGMTIRL